MEDARDLAWSHDGHIRSCDLAATNGIHCRHEVKKGRSAAVDAAGCHQAARFQSDYGSGGRGFESLPARSIPQNCGFSFLGGHRLVTKESIPDVCASTPADRAPLLPLTRRHATSRNAGSHTRLNRSSNRRSRSSVAHRCSLACIPSTRPVASSRLGCGAPTFTGGLLALQFLHCGPAASLRHVAGSPDLGLLRRLRPVPAPSAGNSPARHRPGQSAGRAAPRRFPCSPSTGRRVRRPAFPLQPRYGYAADLPRSLHAQRA